MPYSPGDPLISGGPEPLVADFTIPDGNAAVPQLTNLVEQLNKFFRINKYLTLVTAEVLQEGDDQTNQLQYRVRLTVMSGGTTYEAVEVSGVDLQAELDAWLADNPTAVPVSVLLSSWSQFGAVNTPRAIVIYAQLEILPQERTFPAVPVVSLADADPLTEVNAQIDASWLEDIPIPGLVNLGEDQWVGGQPGLSLRSPLTNSMGGLGIDWVILPAPASTLPYPVCPATEDCCENGLGGYGGGGGSGGGDQLDDTTGNVMPPQPPPPPPIPIATVTASANAREPNIDGSFTIFLSDPAPVGGLTITYTVGGTATPGDDYVTLSGSVFVPAGDTSVVIPVEVIDDVFIEDDETVIMTLTAGTGYTVGAPDEATVTIFDNDTPIYIPPGPGYTFAEGLATNWTGQTPTTEGYAGSSADNSSGYCNVPDAGVTVYHTNFDSTPPESMEEPIPASGPNYIGPDGSLYGGFTVSVNTAGAANATVSTVAFTVGEFTASPYFAFRIIVAAGGESISTLFNGKVGGTFIEVSIGGASVSQGWHAVTLSWDKCGFAPGQIGTINMWIDGVIAGTFSAANLVCFDGFNRSFCAIGGYQPGWDCSGHHDVPLPPDFYNRCSIRIPVRNYYENAGGLTNAEAFAVYNTYKVLERRYTAKIEVGTAMTPTQPGSFIVTITPTPTEPVFLSICRPISPVTGGEYFNQEPATYSMPDVSWKSNSDILIPPGQAITTLDVIPSPWWFTPTPGDIVSVAIWHGRGTFLDRPGTAPLCKADPLAYYAIMTVVDDP